MASYPLGHPYCISEIKSFVLFVAEDLVTSYSIMEGPEPNAPDAVRWNAIDFFGST